MPEISFKVSSRTMRMIGRQNVSSQFVAINELVKNAYDADSPNVTIDFTEGTLNGRGQIIISDSGSGMDLETIVNKWLTIGTDNKEREPMSPNGRVRTGAKGIGRFALDRLGEVSTIETFYDPDSSGIQLSIDWRKYNDSTEGFEGIKHSYEYIDNHLKITGTKIIIDNLRDTWNQEDMQELYEDLSFLIPPLQPEHMQFDMEITSGDFPEINGKIEPATHDNAEILLESTVSQSGEITHELHHKSGLSVTSVLQWRNLFDPPLLFDIGPSCGTAKVSLRIFIGPEGRKLSTVNVRDTAFRKYLKSFRGIRIYRDGFLVKPYGLKNNDWLGLAPRKIRQNQGVIQAGLGDYRLSNHQIIGKVDISRLYNPLLEDRTNREGLIDNNAFKDLRKYLMECIGFVEMQRQIIEASKIDSEEEDNPRDVIEKAKKRSRKTKNHTTSNSKTTKANDNGTDKPKSDVDPSTSESSDPLKDTQSFPTGNSNADNNNIEDASELNSQLDKVIEASERLINENDMLRTLSTIGISAVTLSHELKADILNLNIARKIIIMEISKTNFEVDMLNKQTDSIYHSVGRMSAWTELILRRTQVSRRKMANDFISNTINDIMQNFINSSAGQNITINYQEIGEARKIKFRPIDLESLIVNLLSNAIKSLKKSSNQPKFINIIVDYSTDVIIRVEDSGLGIRRYGNLLNSEEMKTIFLPLTSYSEEDGTGMGLSIVKSICDDNKWSIEAVAENEYSGATFITTIREIE
ncbi:sensor histidine kinase [Deinococcus gobiensis]|uniref:histidine kinase n=1 Tax=Deinococcus gobiensis (strain DSM 21396 / JCM 16679 / CGMCC 1.7299 / I-0) TaxID=745776 RepID=H8H2L7_DEIGI|nr:sensor histidine kinase [Deinococcus gobiensis]AFD27764.1 Histidine kinase [Deinococcus gobiensis I-0]